VFVSLILLVEFHFFVVFIVCFQYQFQQPKHVMFFLWSPCMLNYLEEDFAASALQLNPSLALKMVRINLTEASRFIAMCMTRMLSDEFKLYGHMVALLMCAVHCEASLLLCNCIPTATQVSEHSVRQQSRD